MWAWFLTLLAAKSGLFFAKIPQNSAEVPMRERHECHCMLFLKDDNPFAPLSSHSSRTTEWYRMLVFWWSVPSMFGSQNPSSQSPDHQNDHHNMTIEIRDFYNGWCYPLSIAGASHFLRFTIELEPRSRAQLEGLIGSGQSAPQSIWKRL